MKIIFDSFNCGLGNNGGSRTIIKSAKAIAEMGHSVIHNTSVCRFTWEAVEIPTMKVVGDGSDIVVAVSLRDITHVASEWLLSGRCNKCIWWMRGWENWQGDVVSTARWFTDIGGHIITNSSWLCQQLREYDVTVLAVCFSGLDIPQVCGCYDREKTVGFLWHQRKSKRTDLALRLADQLKDYKFHGFGVNVPANSGNINYFNEPTGAEKLWMFNHSSIWFAPTELEGFHNVAAEASLHGCMIVCNKMHTNGMGDYANDDTANRYDNENEIIDCILYHDSDKVKRMQNILINKIGSREQAMRKFIETLEKL